MAILGAGGRSAGDLEQVEGLSDDFDALLALLDPEAAMAGAARAVTAAVGVPVAMAAVPEGPDAVRITRTHGTRTSALRGILVPTGLGLGGKVTALGAPAWVRDYCSNSSITHDFDAPVAAEGLHGMIAVPVVRSGVLHGVLYGAAREESEFGVRAGAAMEAVAERTGLVLEVAQRARQAAELAVHSERLRVSTALHDSVGALLFAIGAGARDLADAAEALPDLAARARTIEERAGSAALALRRSLHALSATPEQLALGVALQADCRAFQERTAVHARALLLTDLPVLEPAATRALVAAAREALLNVEKHAGATAVVITVAASGGGVAVAVADDGRARPGAAGDADGPAGLGLGLAADRLERLGGHLHVGPNDDAGTTLRAWVPC